MTDARFTQISAEVWITSDRSPYARWTQHSVEVWATSDRTPFTRWTQQSAEVWISVRAMSVPYPIYPTLDGLGYSVTWMPEFANLPTERSANKAEVDIAMANTPIHEFELTYDFLRNYTSPNEFKKFMGFFLRMRANVGRFLFRNPDDYLTTGEPVLPVTDGVLTDFGPIQRTFGVGDDVGIEPVGYVNTLETVNVYLDGVLQSGATYTIDQSFPMNQLVHFLVAPAAGKDVTIDCQYYYYCKFAEENMTFEKFMSTLWNIKRVTLRSLRYLT